MKYFFPALVMLALLAGPDRLFSAEKPNQTSSPAAKGVDKSREPVLKDFSFHDIRLRDAADYLRDAAPGFQAVVVADPQCPDPNPVLPEMALKNVELQQLLAVFTKAIPQLTIEAIRGEKGSVYVFKLAAPESVGGLGGGMGGMGMPGRGGAQTPRFDAYRLSPLIPAGASDRTKALNNILSFLQAALETHGSMSGVVMKVHEPTETLIFRGNQDQTEAVEKALKALEPTQGESERTKMQDRFNSDRERLQSRIAELERRLGEAHDDAALFRKQISQQASEIETLKARLAARSEKSP